MRTSWKLALAIWLMATSGCFGSTAPITVEATSITIRDLQRITVNVTVANEGDTVLEKIEVGFTPLLYDSHGRTTNRSGSPTNFPGPASWGSNYFGPDERLPPESARVLSVDIDYRGMATPSDIYRIVIKVEAQDDSGRWDLDRDECWHTDGTRYTVKPCGTTFHYGKDERE